jgi:enamidase
MVTGDIEHPLALANALYIDGGIIQEIGTERRDADVIIDANGLTLSPGLIDSHVHPVIGDQTPLMNASGWIRAYMHGSGTTQMVSAGEQQLPGLPYDPPIPEILKQEAIFARRIWGRIRPGGVKVRAGTMLAVPGLVEGDFDDLQRAGCTNLKFVFYPFNANLEEGLRYVKWSRERGIVTKFHSGGAARSPAAQPAFAHEILAYRPDIVGHITGGPIAMSREDMELVTRETDCWLEVVSGANYRRNYEFYEIVDKHNAWDRVIFGTDTPSGAGLMPRGQMRNLLFLCGVNGVRPEAALCMASGNVARAHHLPEGVIAPGKPADLFLMDSVRGSVATQALESIAEGDLPGISTVLVDGDVVIRERAEQTPPPQRVARIVKG